MHIGLARLLPSRWKINALVPSRQYQRPLKESIEMSWPACEKCGAGSALKRLKRLKRPKMLKRPMMLTRLTNLMEQRSRLRNL